MMSANDVIKKKYDDIITEIEAAPSPVVVVNACTHGHEKVGKSILDELEKIPIVHGTLIKNLANERAYEASTQYIDSDLNRVFPGDATGDYEQQLAYHIDKIVRRASVVIDIHSTETTAVGENSAVIVTKMTPDTLRLIQTINPPKVLIMKNTENNALISAAKIGLAFEYGKDADPQTRNVILNDIVIILKKLEMVDSAYPTEELWKDATRFYEVANTVPKQEGYELDPSIQNFTLVQAGAVIARGNGDDILAARDFYPILFGKNRYQTIFGFEGVLISNIDAYANDHANKTSS